MTLFLNITLVIHIISGFLALFIGGIALMAAKGKKLHRLSGKLFFYGMLGVAISALIISVVKNNSFLLMIAVFSFYMNYSGFRAIKSKSLQPAAADWLVLGAGAVNAFFMISSLHIVLMVFGGISIFLIVSNTRENVMLMQKQELPPLAWLRRHIGMMIGTYIAAITAFVVVNASLFSSLRIPSWLPWLLPSIVLGPMIGYFIRKYTVKVKR